VRAVEHDASRGPLLLMDLSTSSTTGTFKDWVACYTIA
jgi:hypothetical protein